MLAQDTLYGIGGDGNALVVEDVCQALFAKAWGMCLGLQHGIYDTLRFGGAVDTGRTITWGQTSLLGLMAIFIKGLPGDAEELGDHDHTEDLRRDQSQYATFEVIQLGLNLYWQWHGTSPGGILHNIPPPLAHVNCHLPFWPLQKLRQNHGYRSGGVAGEDQGPHWRGASLFVAGAKFATAEIFGS
jgi:hypothetical protein